MILGHQQGISGSVSSQYGGELLVGVGVHYAWQKSIRDLERWAVLSPRLPVVVNPRRRNVRVPQPLLYLSNIGLVVKRIRGRSRPQRVRADFEPQLRRIPTHDLVNRICRDGSGLSTSTVADGAEEGARVLALKPRFDMYEQANRANEHLWLIDLLVWSAKRSPRRVERMAGVLGETHIPTDAVTVRGVLRRIFDRR